MRINSSGTSTTINNTSTGIIIFIYFKNIYKIIIKIKNIKTNSTTNTNTSTLKWYLDVTPVQQEQIPSTTTSFQQNNNVFNSIITETIY